MNKKANTAVMVIIIALLVLIVGYALIKQNVLSPVGVQSSDVPTININIEQEETTPAPSAESGFDLCESYTKNYPTYFYVKEIQCGAAGGDWICTDSQAGCFDITSWDYTYGCSDSNVQALKAACSIWGGDWTCTATAVGCKT